MMDGMTKRRKQRLEGKVVGKRGTPFLHVDVPLNVGRALGKEDQMSVRVTIEGIEFFGMLRAVYPKPDMSYYPPLPACGFSLYIYKEMRMAVPMKHGTRLNIVLEREDYPRDRRGKRIRDAWR